MTVNNIIDDKFVPAADGRTYELVAPAMGRVNGEAPMSGQGDVDAACDAAARGFDTWRETTPYERSRALMRLLAAVEERAEDFVAVESANSTLPYTVALADRGWQDASRVDRSLALGLNTRAGELTNAPVGEVVAIDAVDLDMVLA